MHRTNANNKNPTTAAKSILIQNRADEFNYQAIFKQQRLNYSSKGFFKSKSEWITSISDDIKTTQDELQQPKNFSIQKQSE